MPFDLGKHRTASDNLPNILVAPILATRGQGPRPV